MNYAARISRLSRRRSTSEVPPQMPNTSPLPRANIKQSTRTGQVAHTALGALELPPLIGKKMSGSETDAQAASGNHLGWATNSTVVHNHNAVTRNASRASDA